MNKKNNRLLLAAAILLALGAGFGLAHLVGTPAPDSTDKRPIAPTSARCAIPARQRLISVQPKANFQRFVYA